jgi:hypothetical protein
MKARYTLPLIALTIGLGGCTAQIPMVAQRPLTSEQKLWVAQHWDEIAEQMAQRLATALSTARAPGQPLVLYVECPPANSVFNQAFHNLLVTRLLGNGFGMTADPGAGLPVHYSAQVIRHGASPATSPQEGFTATSYSYSTFGVPYNELIVNVSVMTGDRFLSRISDIYYIADYDLPNYLAQASIATRTMRVVGP